MRDQARMRIGVGNRSRLHAAGLVALTIASAAVGGCSTFWDDVTSRDFKFSSLFTKKDPLVVLRESNDGDERAKALRALREPKRNGGTEVEQEQVLMLLRTAATSEPQPLCRLSAIQTLGTFQDPRAAEAIKDAFYYADSFNADTSTLLRCQALTSLGQTKSPAAVDLLTKVLKEPRREGTEQDQQQSLDLRIAAARALGNFNHYEATEALVSVLRTEKEDVAVRERAHESLRTATGKDLPADAKAWDNLLRSPNPNGVAGSPNGVQAWLAGFKP